MWTLANGFCFVTFADHAAPVTAVQFLARCPKGGGGGSEAQAALRETSDLARCCSHGLRHPTRAHLPSLFACHPSPHRSGHAVLSASLDGTVRAFDLVRYRNFRTLTTPSPVQFVSLAADPAGDVRGGGGAV